MRVNELARDLEVKAKAILDFLDEIGVEDKRSHSSSIEDELAEKVKAHFSGGKKTEGKDSVGKAESLKPIVVPPPVPPPPVQEVAKPRSSIAAASGAKPVSLASDSIADAKSSAAARRPAVAEPVQTPPRRVPLRPPIKTAVAEPPAVVVPPMPPQAVPIAKMPVAPPADKPTADRSAPLRPAAGSGSSTIPRMPSRPPGRGSMRPTPSLGPAKPGEPIYTRRPSPPQRPGSRPGRPPVTTVPVEPVNRRGPHPVRGRPHGTGARGRVPESVRERPLREMQRPKSAPTPIVVDREITVSEGITVKDLSERLGVKAKDLIRRLFDMGVLATINQSLDQHLAEQVAQSFGAHTRVVTFEEEALEEVKTTEITTATVPRAPVVTVMGHVDHGKTSLLDAIRLTSVAAKEAGSITQHIGAYAVSIKDRKIVFLDTPGHEAFTQMRARGAKVTDVVVLVVAADDGVMPQTLEAINHARAAKVPIVVAINKIDKPGAQPERVMQQLSDHGLVAEKWGGDTVMVEVSAKQKLNLESLLEMILLVTEIQELKASPERPALGTVLEAKLDRGRGPVCTVLVQDGTLRVGDTFLVGSVFGKVRAMLDDLGMPLDVAPPSTPVEVLGLATLPQVGDQFQAVTDVVKAKQIALFREAKLREASLAKTPRLTLDQLHDQLRAGAIKELPILLKADVQGSAEVLANALSKLGDERVKTKIIHAGVGAITISDVLLASASNSVIIGFNVRPERKAADLAQLEEVDIRLHTVIYDVVDEINKAMTGLLEPVHREVAIGKAQVLQTFRVSNIGVVAGSIITEGRINRGCSVRLLRDNVVVHQGKLSSLRRFKDDVSEVKSGLECGIAIENFSDVKPGDVIEAFLMEKVTTVAFV